MDWVKRNLLFVVGLAVSVVLIGAGIFYFMNRKAAADEVGGTLGSTQEQLDTLYKRDPFPSDDNIKAAKAEQERAAAFKKTVTLLFAPPALPEKLDTAGFKAILENSIAEMNQLAQRYGVKLPEKYSFTFESQRQQMQLDQKSLTPLAIQLNDVRQISEILFNSKIHELVSFKRAGVASNEISGGNDIFSKKISSNAITGVVTYPYEVMFNCFSREMGTVLSALGSSKQMLVVKTVNIERGDETSSSDATVAATGPTPAGMDPILAARYGMRGMSPQMMSRYGLGGARPPGATVAPTAAPAPTTKPGGPVLDEKSLRITLGIEVLKQFLPKAPATAQPAKAPQPPAR